MRLDYWKTSIFQESFGIKEEGNNDYTDKAHYN